MKTLKTSIHATLASALILMPLSCARSTVSLKQQRAGIEEIESRHWIHSQHLRSVMSVLERETLTTWPQEVEDEYAEMDTGKANQAFKDAHVLAGRLANSASDIAALADTIRLSEADHRAFVAQADTLRDQAQRLLNATKARNLQHMRADLKSIRATCQSCHERFREFTGPLAWLH